MDSDLSLIEIAGEDDSLLQPIPGADGSSTFNSNAGRTAGYFLCSPLQVPRSNSKITEGVASVDKANFNVECENKENFNVEKSETLKLSVETMKRKRKGGGYNLRKSLAWDRAFFTEEGVLDAAELSMISGNFSKSNKQTLSAIQEEVDSNSSDLHMLEENLFKELPVATSDKTKIVTGNLLPKKRNNEAPTSVANGKVLSNHDVNRSHLKRSACPRPVASSSSSSSTLKRSANLVGTKALQKDSKVSKLPIQKPSPYALPSGMEKSSIPSASDSKRSQIIRPAGNTRKILGPNSTKSVTNNSKAGLGSKCLSTKTSLGQAKRNVASSVKCSTSMQLPLSTEANKVVLNPLHPSTGYPSNFHVGGSEKIAIPLSQNMQNAENQIAKPTGLRMPSPSLGFFGQSKAPTLQSPLKMTSQTCNAPESNIYNLRKFGIPTPAFALKPPLAPRSLPRVTIDGTTMKNIKASGSSSGSSTFPTLSVASHEMVQPNPEVRNDIKVEHKLKNSDKSYETIRENELRGNVDGVDQQSLGKSGQCANKETFDREDIKLHRNDQSLSQRQLDKNDIGMKDVDGRTKGTYRNESENLPDSGCAVEVTDPSGERETVDLKLEEDEPFSFSFNDHSVQFTSGNSSVEQLSGELEVVNPLTFATVPTIGDTRMLQENVADAFPQLHSTEQEKEYISIPDKVTEQSNLEDVTEKPEPEEFPDPLLAKGHALQHGVTMHVDDCLFREKSLLREEAKQENSILSDEPEGGDNLGSELKNPSEPSLLPVILLDDGSDVSKLVECQNQGDSQSLSIDSKLVTENYNPDNQFQYDAGIHDETSVMEPGIMEEGHKADVGTAEDVNVTCQNSGQDTSNIISAPIRTLLLEVDASTDHTIEHADVEEKKLNSSVVSPCCNSDQPEDIFCPDHDDYTGERICVLRGEDDVNKHQEEQDRQMTPCLGEIDRKSFEEKQCPEVDCLVFQDSHSLEKNHKFKNENNASVYPEASSHDGSGLDLSLPVPEKMDHVVKGKEEFDLVIKEQDEKSEFQYPVIQTAVDSPVIVFGVGLGPMPLENFSVEAINEESETIPKNPNDFETEILDHELRESKGHSHMNNEQFVNTELQDPADKTEEVPPLPDDDLGKIKETDPSIKYLQVKADSLKTDLGAKLSDSQVSGRSILDRDDKHAKREQKKMGIDQKQDNLVIKPPVSAVPFSDEWLAAIEAAGEDILTMKSGAVQNSPQDRSQPEPGPWSPVKRKQHQTIGPFDCTKHTNHYLDQV